MFLFTVPFPEYLPSSTPLIIALSLQTEWSVAEVQEFLRCCSNKLGTRTVEYQRIVAENDIDGEVLKDLEDEDLQRLGIKSFGHRCACDVFYLSCELLMAGLHDLECALASSAILTYTTTLQDIYHKGNQTL